MRSKFIVWHYLCISGTRWGFKSSRDWIWFFFLIYWIENLLCVINYHNVMLNAPSWHDFCTDSEKGSSCGIKCVIRWCPALRIGSEVYLWSMSAACWVAAYVVEPFQTAVCFLNKIFFSLEWILLSWYSIIICCRDQTNWIERKQMAICSSPLWIMVETWYIKQVTPDCGVNDALSSVSIHYSTLQSEQE